jgi:hypothetical protein
MGEQLNDVKVGVEVLTPVVMNSSVFRDITLPVLN